VTVVNGPQNATRLDRVQADHPNWTLRRDAGADWSCWTAQRVRVIMAPSLGELAAKLDIIDGPGLAAGDPRVAAASELLGERHEPVTMTPGDLRTLLGRFRQAAAGLLDVIVEAPAGPPVAAVDRARGVLAASRALDYPAAPILMAARDWDPQAEPAEPPPTASALKESLELAIAELVGETAGGG
jgi:hypothetical protein